MHTDSMDGPGNRAVTALFRVFGGSGRENHGCAGERACFRGMHLPEYRFLALWIPLSVCLAVAHPLIRMWGVIPGCLAAFPLGFLLMNLLPCALGGRSPVTQWRMWLGMFVLWAWFHRDAGGITGGLAWCWLGLAVLNTLCWGMGAFQSTLNGTGPRAIAWRMFLLVASHAAVLLLGFAYGWPWAIAAGGLVAVMFCVSVLHPSCRWLGPVRTHTEDPGVLITIDDGPDPHDTPVLLDLLDAYQMKAVFFMIGEKVRAHPDLAREVLRRGHEIGNHSWSHPHATFWCAGPRRTRREITSCDEILQEITGVKPKWFRAPVGHRNLFTHPVARELDLGIMAWSRRGFDAVEKDATKVLDRILPKLRAGDIVLLHEATPIAAEVLEGVLKRVSSPQFKREGSSS